MNEQVFPKGFVRRLLYPSLIERFLRVMREAEYFYYKKENCKLFLPFYLFYRVRYHRLCIKTGFDIPLNTLGYGCRIGHLSTIVINGNTKIGNYCSFSNNIIIADGHPKCIGNDVFFGSNVVLAKEINIPDGCHISSNSFLNHSINYANSLVGGVVAKAIKKSPPWTTEEPYKRRRLNVSNLERVLA